MHSWKTVLSFISSHNFFRSSRVYNFRMIFSCVFFSIFVVAVCSIVGVCIWIVIRFRCINFRWELNSKKYFEHIEEIINGTNGKKGVNEKRTNRRRNMEKRIFCCCCCSYCWSSIYVLLKIRRKRAVTENSVTFMRCNIPGTWDKVSIIIIYSSFIYIRSFVFIGYFEFVEFISFRFILS